MSLKEDLINAYQRRGTLAVAGYALEAFGLALVFGVLKILPLDKASDIGGWIGRKLGPCLGLHHRAEKNLRRAMPELGLSEREDIIMGMWENLGRTMAEYPHLDEFQKQDRFEAEGLEHIRALRDDGKPGILVGGHLGNWEIGATLTGHHGLPMAIVFRNPNNPFVAAMLDWARQVSAPYRMPKGPQGGLALARHLKRGGHIGLLVDQKLNEGLPLKFFGLPAMTAPAPAQWALRNDIPIIALRTRRLSGARFRISFEPLEKPEGGDTPDNIAALTQNINDTLERFIRDDPKQWLWVHRRWKD